MKRFVEGEDRREGVLLPEVFGATQHEQIGLLQVPARRGLGGGDTWPPGRLSPTLRAGTKAPGQRQGSDAKRQAANGRERHLSMNSPEVYVAKGGPRCGRPSCWPSL
jgi:hypothetical protein